MEQDTKIKITAEVELAKLLELQRKIAAELHAIKQEAEEVELAIRAKVSDAVASARRELQKFEGTVHAAVEGIEVISTVPKRVEWDSDKLDTLTGELVAMGADPSSFIEFELKISERKYETMPEPLRSLVAQARTVKHGKETFKFNGA